MDRLLRSLGCVVKGEWVGSPRRLAYAHVASDKKEKKIGEAKRKRHPRGFSFQARRISETGGEEGEASLGEKSLPGLTGCGGFDSQDDLRLHFFLIIFISIFYLFPCRLGIL